MNQDAMRAALDACILASDEIAEGFDGWADHDDPMPPWDMTKATTRAMRPVTS